MNNKYSKLIISAAIILLIILGINFYKKHNRNVIDEIISMKDMINILVAGRNVYNENTFSFFALITINPVNNNIGITFIPPDYRIMMNDDGTKVKKISEIDLYYFDRIKYTLKKDIQMNVPFYIKLYSPDIVRAVNLIEGVDIFSLDQSVYSSKNNFGLQYLDGEKSVSYINSSEQNSIYMKYDRILDLILTLYNDKENRKKLFNYQFIDELFKNIKTNLMSQELYSIAEIIFEKGNVDSTLLPGGFNNGYYVVDEVSYRTYQQEFLTNLVVETESEPTVKIKILNGTSIPGLARKLRNDLIRDGMNVVEFGTSDYPAIYDSIIICRKSDIKSVNKISEMTGIGKIYFVTDTTQLNNILIVVGEDMAK
ncbi:MAG TPA: LytR C-terminal domain-containing protein [Spirochaetota bacterium]|nr:LytR C-terminal domain-containing protein [Spirochaetota bacterium]